MHWFTCLEALARGEQPPAAVTLTWGIHQGMREARWIHISSTGEVSETIYLPNRNPAPRTTFRRALSAAEVAAIARLAMIALKPGEPAWPSPTPGPCITLEAKSDSGSCTLSVHPAQIDRCDALRALALAFAQAATSGEDAAN